MIDQKAKLGFPFLFIAAILLFSNTFAQKRAPLPWLKDTTVKERVVITLQAGMGFPSGDYGSKDVTNDSAGYANSGLNIGLSAAYRFTSSFAISTMVRFQSNSLDGDAMSHIFSKQYPGIDWKVFGDPWKIWSYLAGPQFEIPVDEKKRVAGCIRVMGGAMQAASPKLQVTATKNGASLWVNQSSVKTVAFNYLLSFGIKFKLRSGHVLIFADYQNAKPVFDGAVITSSSGNSSSASFRQGMNTITAGIGFGIDL